jgi:hypothetical protein
MVRVSSSRAGAHRTTGSAVPLHGGLVLSMEHGSHR